MSDSTILQLSPITTPDASDYLVIARVGGNRKMKVSDLFVTASLVSSFNTRVGAVTLVSADLNGLSGAGLTGIGTGTGGVINTGTTTIGGDSDANGVGVVSLQTRGLDRVIVANNGKVGFAGQTSPTGWLDVLPATTETVLRASRNSGTFVGFSFLQNQDASCGPFEWLVNSGVNPGGIRRDTFCQFGYNPQGITDDMRLYFAIETRWNPSGTQVQNEVYLDYISPSNGGGAASIRPFGWTIREDVQNILTDAFTSVFRVWDWPGNPGADHPYIQFEYPSLYIHDGNLSINPNSYPSVSDFNGVAIRGEFALQYDTGGLLQVGNNTGNKTKIHGNVAMHPFNDPVGTWRVQVGSAAADQVSLLVDGYNDSQTVNILEVRNPSIGNVFTVDKDGAANASVSFKVAGTKVVGTRATGWGAATGTATRTTFATGSVTLPQLAERVKALVDDLIAHGMVGA